MIGDQRHLFDIPRDVAYFNCAYMSPLLKAAAEAGRVGLERKLHPWKIAPIHFFDEAEILRGLYGEVIGASGENIAITPSSSYGMATAAANLPLKPGQTVVIPAEEFPSGVHIWARKADEAGARIVTVARPTDGDWTAAILAAIDSRTAIVCTSQVHWVCGGLIDLVAVSKAAKAQGAALVVDITQSASVVDPMIAAADPDFIVASGYKWLLGPYSLAFLYAAPRYHEGRPLEEGWIVREGAQDFARLVDYKYDYQGGARRFDMGERANFAAIPVAVTACRQLLEWGQPALATTLGVLTGEIVARAQDLGASALQSHLRGPHYLGLRFASGLPAGVAATLAANGVTASVRGDRLRVTPHLYTDGEDIERLFAALKIAVSN